jgi:predicted transposase/invertase (TIGR01784 family)
MSEIQNPHDQFVRSTLSDKAMAKSFLENYLPFEIVETLDLTTVNVTQQSFVDQDLQDHHTDLLYQVAAKTGENVLVYVLLEHKSFPEKRVAFQLLRYILRIWEQQKSSAKLPNIVPLVLYHGKRKWNINREFAPLVEFGKDAVYAKSTPNFEYFLCDLSKFDERELKGEIALRITLLLLKNIFSPDLKHKLVDIMRLFAEIPKSGVVELLGKTLKYLSASDDKISRSEVRLAMQTSFTTEQKQEDWLQEFIDEWKEEAMKKGLEEGRQQGVKEGRQEGMQQGMQQALAKTVERLLKRRFNQIPDSANVQINELSVSQLEKLSEDLLDFNEIGDFEKWVIKNSN